VIEGTRLAAQALDGRSQNRLTAILNPKEILEKGFDAVALKVT
jgi:hypothetical protein